MADRLISCLISQVEKIGKCIFTQYLLPPMKRHIDYWWCFDNNIRSLRDEIQNLEIVTSGVSIKIEEARLRTEEHRLEKWSKAGSEMLVVARRILQDDINPKAWNLFSRYSMGKRAKKAAEEIAEHRNGGPGPIMEFESRKRTDEEIMESLRSSTVGLIGICGMGGVGKTSMAKKIMTRVKKENLFDEVVMVIVSKRDMIKIQGEIAEWLQLEIKEEHIAPRAEKLRTRLQDTKRKLIILDDVWERVKLEDLGVHIERCKILLTTRSKDLCKRMDAQQIFEMKILTEEEAWILFKDNAGHIVEDSALLSVAKDVAAECKGLPIALVTVGKALQNKEKYIWVDSLAQLRRANPEDFSEVLDDVYKPLKLSYDRLESERQKLLFLLCCLFPEDYDIPVEQLTWYSMGLSLFDGITSIAEARNRTSRVVDELKSRFLLMDALGEYPQVKMHDVVRDVAIYIGTREEGGFLKILEKTSMDSSDVNCKWMSLDFSNERVEVPAGLHFPKLLLLMLRKSSSNKFSDISFEGMKDLNVLFFSGFPFGSIPPTLKNLRTLYLYRCTVENISVIGELAGLEILSCHECYDFEELPAEIGKLNRLRLLELCDCYDLQTIAFGVISSLFQLEELMIVNCFRGWEAEEDGKERRNASLTELEALHKLTCLQIEIDDWNLAVQDIRFSQNFVKFWIRINPVDWYGKRSYEKAMNLNLPSDIGAVGHWIRLLVKSTESLFLQGDGSSNINIEECQDLRNLVFRNCSMVKKLVKTEDCKSLNQNVSFCNLKSADISSCSNLRTLFSVSMARSSLPQLEVLEIRWCDKMEQVFWNDITDDTDASIEFPKLKTLTLRDLPHLTAFCQGIQTIKFPNLTDLEIDNVAEIFDGTILPSQNFSLGNLKSAEISSCSNLRTLFSVSMARSSLSQLEVLEIRRCHKMEQVFRNDITDDTDASIEFPKLKTLRLRDLPNLTAFCQGVETIKFPNLTNLGIGYLPKLNSLCPLNSETTHDDTTSFHFLCNQKVEMGGVESLTICYLGANIRNIWCDQIPINFFNNIQSLDISKLNGIRSLMSYSIAKNFVSLKYLEISNCEEMIEVIEGNDDDKEVLIDVSYHEKRVEMIESDDKRVVDIKCLFSNLRSLYIIRMLKLKSFWQWNQALELPLLEQVYIYDCQVMEAFSLGSLNTPNLKRIDINRYSWRDQKDLNHIIRQHWTLSLNNDDDKNKNKNKNKDTDEDEDTDQNEDNSANVDANEDEDVKVDKEEK